MSFDRKNAYFLFHCTAFYYIYNFSTGATNHCGFVFFSPLADHSLLAYEVSLSHTTTRHSQQDSSGRVIIRRRDLYLTTHNTHNRQTSMTPVGFEPTIAAGKRPQSFYYTHTHTHTHTYIYIYIYIYIYRHIQPEDGFKSRNMLL